MLKILLSILMVVGVTSALVMGAVAVFTDMVSSPNNVFSVGTLDLTMAPATAMFTVSQMAPGDVVYSGLQLINSGNLALRYAITTTPDGASTLDEQLDLTIDVVTAAGADTTWYTADDTVGAANVFGPDGVLSAAAIGSPNQGAQSGDRSLPASGSERLRFKVTLPPSTPNGYQGTNCIVAFVFNAEQTANNP